MIPEPSDTRTRILDAALELFSEQGFDGTTLQQIADRLGFTKAALYYHFRSKDDLLHALVGPAVTGLDELLESHEAMLDTPARRRRFTEAYLDHVILHRRLTAYIARDLAVVAHPAFASGRADRRERVEALLAGDGLDFHEQVRVAMAFYGIGRVIAQYPDADCEELRAALLDAIRAVLRPSRRHPRVSPRRHLSTETLTDVPG